MANKTIIELTEIEIADLDPDQLMVLDTGLETFKVRLSSLVAFASTIIRKTVNVEFDGIETGEKEVDVGGLFDDARVVQWMLKKPAAGSTNSEQMNGIIITCPDFETVVIDTGDFALDAGTYVLLGV